MGQKAGNTRGLRFMCSPQAAWLRVKIFGDGEDTNAPRGPIVPAPARDARHPQSLLGESHLMRQDMQHSAKDCDSFEAAALQEGRVVCGNNSSPTMQHQRAELTDERGCKWQPGTCRLHMYSADEACRVLLSGGFNRVLMVGDSFMRHLHISLMVTVFGLDAVESNSRIVNRVSHLFDPMLPPVEAKFKEDFCPLDLIMRSQHDGCRNTYARDTWLHLDERRKKMLCGGRVSLEYMPSQCCHCLFRNDSPSIRCGYKEGKSNQSLKTCHVRRCDEPDPAEYFDDPSFLAGKRHANTSASLVVLGWGLEANYNITEASAMLAALLHGVDQNFSRPTVIWHAADARIRRDFPRQMPEMPGPFNLAMETVLARPALWRSASGRLRRPAAIPIVNFQNMTRDLASQDGTHWSQGSNLMKAHLLLRRIEDLSQSRDPKSTSQPPPTA